MSFIIARVIAIGLLLWALDKHPYGYYTILRFVTCGVAAYGAYMAHAKNKNAWIWIFGAMAVLFNPLIPIHADKGTWGIIDVAAAGILLISILVLKK